MEWIFEGIGTEIISIVISLVIGGVVGYKIGIKKASNQKQIAGDDADQKQIINIEESDFSQIKKANIETSIVQSQKAGDSSSQSQIGEIRNNGR